MRTRFRLLYTCALPDGHLPDLFAGDVHVQVVGDVSKQVPCALEALYFRGEEGPHVIECPALSGGLRLGVGICYENQLAYLPCAVAEGSADMLLMPHCAPFVEGVPKAMAEEWVAR